MVSLFGFTSKDTGKTQSLACVLAVPTIRRHPLQFRGRAEYRLHQVQPGA